MKRLLWIMIACLPLGGWAMEVEPLSPDTTVYIEGKKITVRDDDDRLKVRVYDMREEGDMVEDELVFEGHYRNGQNYEKRKYAKSITIPLPSRNRGFDPHWAGVNLGFANFADGDLRVNDIDGVSLKSEKSWELNLNVWEHDFRLSRRYGWGLVTGVGIRWDRYRLDGNHHFARVDGRTLLVPAPEGVHYTKSRLNITSLTIPLLLEWQHARNRWESDFFISAGVVGVVKTASSSKIQYRDERGKKVKKKMDEGLYLRPISMDFLLQMGYDWIGLYVKYSPFELFENHKGPAVHPVSLGIQLHI